MAGPLCSLIFMKRCGAILWDVWFNGGRVRGSAHHQEGGVDSFLVPHQESMWTHQGPCGHKKIVEEPHELVKRGILVEVGHVKALRMNKNKKR